MPPTRVQGKWSPPSRSTAATGRRPSPRSSGRSTSPSRCGRRWPATGSTTPTSSPGRAAAARRRARGSWPGRSTASRRRSPTRAGVRQLPRPGPRRAGVDRRHRDRRGVARRRRRRARPAGEGVLRAGARPLQGLHHRRGPHGLDAGLQRPAQAGRGAAGAPALHLRDHRAGEGHPDHPVAHPPLPVPADPAAAAVVLPLRALREGGRRRSSRRRCRWSSGRAPARPATPSRCSTS